MNDQQPAAIGGEMDRPFLDRDVSVRTGKGGNEFVVIAGNVNHADAFARFAQDFLDHVIVRLGPVAPPSQLPDVDQVADDVEFLAVIIAQELEQRVDVAGARSQMHV